PDRMLYSVPYDFDMSGLVHPPYAIPARGLPIQTVDQRLYRGPCQTPELVDPILANFNAKRPEGMALPDAIAGMNRSTRQEARAFLEGFYSSIKSAGDVKRLFVEGCSKAPTM